MSDDPSYREPDERMRRALLAERDALVAELATLDRAARNRHRAFWGVGGACVCGEGLTYCESQDVPCVDTLHDPENCGGCGMECPEGHLCLPGGVCGAETTGAHPR